MWAPSSPEDESSVVSGESYRSITSDMRVLVVDDDENYLSCIANMLESCLYKVTVVEHAVAAFLMLNERRELFDLVLAEIHLPDIDGFTLTHEAVKMKIPAILMSRDNDVMNAWMALENGACFFLKKPIPMEVLKNLWQFVTRDKVAKVSRFGYEGSSISGDDNETAPNYLKSKGAWKKKSVSRKSSNKNEVGKNKPKQRAGKKPSAEWTDELHSKFMEAVKELGEGRCYPKEILQLMNVPGLTRMQVASHLQKCRHDNWRAPDTRKPASSCSGTSDSDPLSKLVPVRRFGSTPRVIRFSTSAQISLPEESSESHTGPQMYSPLCNDFSRTMTEEDPTQLINPQPEVNLGGLIDPTPLDHTKKAFDVPAIHDHEVNGDNFFVFLPEMNGPQTVSQLMEDCSQDSQQNSFDSN